MNSFEYTAIPAPLRSEKSKAAKSPSERYALTLTEEINRMAADGWEYLRAETLPSEERSGLTGRTTLFHNLLIFRRPKAATVKPRALTEAEAKGVIAAPATPAAATGGGLSEAAAKRAEPEIEAEAASSAGPAASPIFSEPMRAAKLPTEDKT
ncbi:DUF4177 domain-containing protein [Paracoccus sp. S1E-3]|uniref:DUF4177 domain-containing protein n=1 Tax=Paracoccus sp. S1E-3 TaxID=2756130 RepID=UPI0015EF0F1C|nr:DUF4177 domain-containing protein [Paracoccus sp. S1E-3]MBA4491413.1 DUF4177 domain-containing protein [Paracoccus sp. S1E-3]